MAAKAGMNFKAYYSATALDSAEAGAGSNKASDTTWIEIANIRDNNLNLETGEADVTTRGNNGWRQTIATLKDGSVEFEMVYNTSDAAFTAIKDAWLAG